MLLLLEKCIIMTFSVTNSKYKYALSDTIKANNSQQKFLKVS